MTTPNINTLLRLPCNKVCSRYGAQMGRACLVGVDVHRFGPLRNADPKPQPESLHLQQVSMSEGYDPGGAYWGWPADLWCAFSGADSPNEFQVRIFVRGGNREVAKTNVLQYLREKIGTDAGWSFKRK